MPARRTVQQLIGDCLGKHAAKALFRKIERMSKEGATAATIEKVIITQLLAHIKVVLRKKGAAPES